MVYKLKIRPYVPVCGDCGEKTNIIEDFKNGYNVCGNCGCVVGERLIDDRSEWRSFGDSNTDDPSRVGGPSNPLLDMEQLDTVIGSAPGTASHKLARTQMRSSMRGPERALINGFNLITAFCERSNISRTIMDKAKVIFKTVETKKILRGKNTEGVVAACIYIACRQQGHPRTFKEISVLTSVSKREIGRSYKIMFPHIDKISQISTEDIVERFCSDLTMGIKAQKLASTIAKKVQENGCMAGKSPDSVAAAIIYLVINLMPENKGVQKDVPFVTNVSEVTIKNTYKDLLNERYNVIPPDIFPKTIIDKLPSS
ncbi:Transcription initiation factor TFIIB [Spraguea lophii 42_110]|uniref:Transcription initiation factor IIB n=1 Tax=Spraguea lophii (strain 42_110) TaxID=1358809 RepID=S7W8R4_SPRLO|nr:Transcription initiation factor TFIIB [Spraguea lophii 42_110]